MQVVIQVFFVALCNNMNQHSVHTGQTITKFKTFELNRVMAKYVRVRNNAIHFHYN